MATNGNKFGAFKGVFTPSILTILGVIMYLRLPWIVGQAGLWATLGIILVAHIISATTGLSVASIATDKKVETGGTYYMISRSLGLPIGGTLGLALFVGLSFSVSLYIIGFAETLLTAFDYEVTINNIRIAGVITLLVVTIITFISTNLALKTQFVILAVLILSVASVLLGKHDLAPQTPLSGMAANSLPWIALFAIFFPAVTGFEAGVSMSGDLANPKKAIPRGTITAIIVGLLVYIGLAFFFSHTVERDSLVNDPAVLLNISIYSPLVVAGIWGATLSSAFGSILGAPRILQATAIDRITPKIFAKGVGAGNEPRNAIILTFFIALAGILIGELNVIARVVSIFFIITYGFLNLTCAIENWAGSDFRPSFRIPAWISIIGAIACFVVMIQLDFAAMIGATVLLGAIFLFLKRKELKLQSGDTWGGFWSSLVKYGLIKLSQSESKNQRNWRPNIILFGGNPKSRPYLINMARTLVGSQGVFTNFNLVEKQSEKVLFEKHASPTVETDQKGKPVVTRNHSCNDVYEGMRVISSVYGFTGFEPNTILMGWGRKSKDPEKFIATVGDIKKLDYNLVFLNHKECTAAKKVKRIDLWWNGNSRNLNFGLALLKYIKSDTAWRTASLRILVPNYNTAKTDSIYALVNQVLDNSRLLGSVKVINNATEKISEVDLVKTESSTADLVILELNTIRSGDPMQWMSKESQTSELPCSSLIIEANSGFEEIDADTIPQAQQEDNNGAEEVPSLSLQESISFPAKELLADEARKIAINHEVFQQKLVHNSVITSELLLKGLHKDICGITDRVFSSLEKYLQEPNKSESSALISKALSELTYQSKNKFSQLQESLLEKIFGELKQSLSIYVESVEDYQKAVPRSILVNFYKDEFRIKRKDSASIKLFKSRFRTKGLLLGWPLSRKIELAQATRIFLQQNRLESLTGLYNDFGLSTFRFISNLRRCLVDLSKEVEQFENNTNSGEAPKTIAELKKQTAVLLEESINDLISSNKRAIQSLNADLEQNMQRLCFVIGKPEMNYLLKPYKKIISRKHLSISSLEQMPAVWYNNLTLFANKNQLEFILISLRNRFKVKLHKQVDELTRWTNGKLLENINSIKSLLQDVKTSQALPDTSNVIDRILDLRNSAMQERFEAFYKDVSEIVNELPEKIDVNGERFFTDVEKGNFAESDVRTIALRKQAQFFVGTELISNVRNSMDGVSVTLKDTASRLGDKLRLASFNIENLILQGEGNEDNSQSIQLQEKLAADLLKDIAEEESKVSTLLEKFSKDLNQYIKATIDPLYQLIYSRMDNGTQERAKRKLSNPVLKSIGNGMQVIRSFINRQVVRILYSRSEGIMLAQKFTNFEKEFKISNQLIQEMLVGLSGQKQILNNIPFYYASLFSGSTTLNRELWVIRSKEQKEAEAIANRFKSGYSGGLLITGGRNTGKSTLSKYIAKTYLPNHELNIVKPPKGGSVRKDDFHKALKKALNIETDVYGFLNSSPNKRAIIINDLELWWERHEDGLEIVKEIASFIETFGSDIFIIVNCGSLSYQLINRLVKLDTSFMGQIECEPFNAEELKQLVLSRHRTGGLKLQLNGKSEDKLTEWNLAQLFNKYFNLSDGNPGYTLNVWLSNITKVVGKTIHIKLPVMPNVSHLNSVSDELWMVILQIALHRRCSIDRLARVLRQNESKTKDLLKNMQRSGLVEERFPGIFAINALLEPHLVGKLKEKGFC